MARAARIAPGHAGLRDTVTFIADGGSAAAGRRRARAARDGSAVMASPQAPVQGGGGAKITGARSGRLIRLSGQPAATARILHHPRAARRGAAPAYAGRAFQRPKLPVSRAWPSSKPAW